LKVTFGAEVTDGQPEDREAIELGENVLLEWQKAGQSVQLSVQPFAVPLARIALRHAILWRRFQAATQNPKKRQSVLLSDIILEISTNWCKFQTLLDK